MNRVQSDAYWYDAGYKTAKKETIDRVLESIDSICDDFCTEELNCIPLITRVIEIRDSVRKMKGGDQE